MRQKSSKFFGINFRITSLPSFRLSMIQNIKFNPVTKRVAFKIDGVHLVTSEVA